MKGEKKVIQLLNKGLAVELTAINQYFLHAWMYKNLGLNALGEHEYEESIEEMKHADKLIERTLFLEGLPNLQPLNKLMIGENVPECLSGDLKLDLGGRELYIEATACCESVKDYRHPRQHHRNPGRLRGAHRQPGDPVRSHQANGSAQLPARRDGLHRLLSTAIPVRSQRILARMWGWKTISGPKPAGTVPLEPEADWGVAASGPT